jgi:hypothetical protein
MDSTINQREPLVFRRKGTQIYAFDAGQRFHVLLRDVNLA